MKLANCLTTLDFDIICLTETWLTAEISDSALFIPNYVINRKDRQSTESKSKHGGVLVAAEKGIPFETVNLKITHDDFLALKITISETSILLVCIYNPPHGSRYQWTTENFLKLLTEFCNLTSQEMIQCTPIVGDINLSGTDWEAMDSNDNYESEIQDKLIESNFSNISNQTLDVVLTNNTHPVIECYQHQNLHRSFEVNKKQCSDHLPILTSVVFLGTIVKNSNTCRKFAIKRADWKKLNQALEEKRLQTLLF